MLEKCQLVLELLTHCSNVPIAEPQCVAVLTSTHTAQDVKPYTKAKGRCVRNVQHPRSHFLAQLLLRREGDVGGEGGARVAMVVKCVRYRLANMVRQVGKGDFKLSFAAC